MARERKKPEGSFIERAKNEIECSDLCESFVEGFKFAMLKAEEWVVKESASSMAEENGNDFIEYMMKIEEPSADKNLQEFDADYLQSKIDAFTDAQRKDGKTADDILNECRGGSLDLTWQDVKRIVEIADDILKVYYFNKASEEEYYTEVLRRFKEQ